ncbi:RNase H family protein [Reichenbachiella sp.]|uniref:ribonuclease HI n=1 Tax=Reichenbachiella sp. TaxID=2184521 RepID=UPI0032978A62
MTNPKMLFTDGSVDALLKIGYGAYMFVDEDELPIDPKGVQVKVKRFEDTSSTKLELQTLIWALTEIGPAGKKVLVYTDSQNIIGLPARRDQLEKNDYHSRRNELLNNHELYRELFKIMDRMDCQLIKVKGHLSSSQKGDIDKLFARVDRASRKALRETNK